MKIGMRMRSKIINIIGGVFLKSNDFYYVSIDIQKSEVFSCGGKFSEFINFISIKPDNILLMKGNFYEGHWNNKIGLDYADKDNINDLISDDVYNYGDFVWVDYEDKDAIDNIPPMELAELLYISHMKIPFNTPFLKSLNNNYIYLAHDDNYWTKIYMKNIYDYKKVIEGKILKELKGRKKEISPIPEHIMNLIFDGACEGILIDFESTYYISGSTGVNIYKMGKYRDYDQIHDVLERKKDCRNLITLEYRNKKYELISDISGKSPRNKINPDEVVALGAAVQAGLKSGQLSKSGLIATDVAPFSMGIAVLKEWKFTLKPGGLSVIIPRNTTIPVTRTEEFTTSYDGQTAVSIEIYQGENEWVSSNYKLGEFLLEGVPANDAGEEVIEVKFRYNLNGILEVSAKCVSNNKEMTVIIQDALDRDSEEAYEDSIERVESLYVEINEEDIDLDELFYDGISP